jgi:WD domain, G-beta repeat
VAALLPTGLGDHAHVHVTSRPHPELPAAVYDLGHPLVHTRPTPLQPFPGWETLRGLGNQEVDELAKASGLSRDLLGLLTAAAGPLSIADLAWLHNRVNNHDVDESDIQELLAKDAARSLQTVGLLDRARYAFAHDSLLERAQADTRLAKPTYRKRIHAWADTWREDGWPETDANGNTLPRYLLDSYPATLAAEPERLASVVGDINWVSAAVHGIGVDATLATLRSAAHGDSEAADVLATVAAQEITLRSLPRSARAGLLSTLCLQALRYGMETVAAAARARLETLPGPRLIPISSSQRSLPPRRELGSHDGGVGAVAVDRAGRWVVTGGYDGRVRLWQVDAPGTPTELGSHDRSVGAVAVDPAGRWVVTGGYDGRVRLWQVDAPGTPTELIAVQVAGLAVTSQRGQEPLLAIGGTTLSIYKVLYSRIRQG